MGFLLKITLIYPDIALPPLCISQSLYHRAIVNVELHYICFHLLTTTLSLYFILMANGSITQQCLNISCVHSLF